MKSECACAATQEPPKEVDSRLTGMLSSYKGEPGEVISILQQIQREFGYLPEQAMRQVAKFTGVDASKVFGVATFYAQFRLKPVGKHIIRVCHGTACHVQNATAITDELVSFLNIKDGETTADRLFTLESVACLGCCSLAPVMMIGDDTFGKLNKKKTVDVIKDIKRKESLAVKEKLTDNISKN
jgi:NADH-quinone oxidoreductase subunit E